MEKTKVNKTYDLDNDYISAGVKFNWLSFSRRQDFLDYSYDLTSINNYYPLFFKKRTL